MAASVRIVVADPLQRAIHNLVGSHRKLPIVGIDAQTHHQVAELLRLEGRLHILRLVRLGVAKIGRTKKHCGSSSFRFNQSLSGVEFELGQRERDFAKVRMSVGVVANFMSLVN